jgi:hypothetical protein
MFMETVNSWRDPVKIGRSRRMIWIIQILIAFVAYLLNRHWIDPFILSLL